MAEQPAPRSIVLSAAFVAGFVITGVEITLGRLLAPYFGASLAVWAAIIASVIAALTIGYVLGGVWIDRRPLLRLPVLVLLAGGVASAVLGVASPYFLGNLMDGVAFHGTAYWSRLAMVLFLFGIACAALAMVAPGVLRLALGDRQSSGHVAGWVYGVGSAGSVLGILLPALWWIPHWGVKATFLVLGALSAIPAVVAALGRVGGAAAASGLAVFILAGAASTTPPVREPDIASARVISEGETPLQHFRILERREPDQLVRWLQVNEAGASQSILVEPGLATDGVWDWLALSALHVRPDDGRVDVLIIGLAAGTVARMLHEVIGQVIPSLRVVGVEIDGSIVQLGQQYFGLDPSSTTVHVADGRMFLRSADEKFDLIILDAYRPPSIPAHLATVEFFREVSSRLAPRGLAALNVFSPQQDTSLLLGLVATWREVFPNPQWVVAPVFDGFTSRLLLGGGGLPVRYESAQVADLPPYWRKAWEFMAQRTEAVPPGQLRAPWTDDRSDIELQTDYAYRRARPPAITRSTGS